jgi:hypothetical protein
MKMTNVSTPYAIKKEGDFCITTAPNKTSFIQFCPRLGTCSVEIKKEAAVHPVWHWNGDYENPTISPSIGCETKGICCPKHINVTNGIVTP